MDRNGGIGFGRRDSAGVAIAPAAVAQPSPAFPLSLPVVDPVAAIPVYLLAPAGVALLLAGGSSQAYVRIGLIGCVVAGLESAIWIGALSNERVIATVIGAIVSFAILSIVGAFVCYVVGRVVFRGAGG